MTAANDWANILSAIGGLFTTLAMFVSAVVSVYVAIQQRKHGQKLDQIIGEQKPDDLYH